MRELTIVSFLLALCSCSRGDSVIVIGSKNFTENLFLGELLAQHIEARTDLTVERRLNLGGTFLCHQALRSGELDMYPEYTGTALTAILRRPVARDPDEVFRIVASVYREEVGAEWMAPFGFNNTYAIVVRAEDAEREGWRKASDLASSASQIRIGFGFEFFERQDGYHGFVETYQMSFGKEPKTMDLNLVYQALRDGEVDVGVGNSTDGLISAFRLSVLEDDKQYFPPYDAAAVVRLETLQRHPALREVLAELGGLLSEREMRKLNYEIDGRRRTVAEVARELRREKGLTGAGRERQRRAANVHGAAARGTDP